MARVDLWVMSSGGTWVSDSPQRSSRRFDITTNGRIALEESEWKSMLLRSIAMRSLLAFKCGLGFNLVLWTLPSKGAEVESVHITPSSSVIQVGEPLFLEVDITYSVAPSGTRSGAAPSSLKEVWQLEVTRSGDTEVITSWEVGGSIWRQDEDGFRYMNQLPVFFSNPKKRFTFPQPGEYPIRLLLKARKVNSNVVHIDVEPASEATSGALALLEEPEDFGYLYAGMEGLEHKPEARRRLEAIVEQFGSSILADYASVRLGVAKFNKVFEEHNIRGGAVYRECYDLLKKGLQLPVRSPVREEALFHLAMAETLAGDYAKAKQHVNVLRKEYATGRRGSDAQMLLSEIERAEQNAQRRENEPD